MLLCWSALEVWVVWGNNREISLGEDGVLLWAWNGWL